MTQAVLTEEKTPGRATTEPPSPPPAEPQKRRRATPARPQMSRRANMVKVVMGIAIWSMPMLRPAGPGNTAPADLFLGLAILVTALWFASRNHVMRFPYMLPVGLFILAGALASTVAFRHAYVSVGGGLVSLIQDAFLLAWCIGIANVGRDPALLRSMSRAWAISATCWAALMIIGVFGHISFLSGQDLRNGVRAAFTLGDANLAANYFICSLLVLRAARFPRRRALRWACCALIITAIILTGSNGGALVLIVTTVAGAIFRMARRRGAAPAIITATVLALAVLLIAPRVPVQSIVARAQTSSQFLNDSIGRQAESTGSRSMILSQTEQLYLNFDTPSASAPAGPSWPSSITSSLTSRWLTTTMPRRWSSAACWARWRWYACSSSSSPGAGGSRPGACGPATPASFLGPNCSVPPSSACSSPRCSIRPCISGNCGRCSG